MDIQIMMGIGLSKLHKSTLSISYKSHSLFVHFESAETIFNSSQSSNWILVSELTFLMVNRSNSPTKLN